MNFYYKQLSHITLTTIPGGRYCYLSDIQWRRRRFAVPKLSCPKRTRSKDVELGFKLKCVYESWDGTLLIFALVAPRMVPNTW